MQNKRSKQSREVCEWLTNGPVCVHYYTVSHTARGWCGEENKINQTTTLRESTKELFCELEA